MNMVQWLTRGSQDIVEGMHMLTVKLEVDMILSAKQK